MTSFKPVTHVIFDFDGLILDTEPAYDSIYEEIARQHGKEFSWELKVKFMGTVERETCRIFTEDLGLPVSPEEVFREQQARQPRALAGCALKPGAERLVRHLVGHGVPVAVATSSSAESMGYKTTHHKELMALFHHVVMGSSDPDVKQGKPHPDIFLVCASRFPDRPQPHQCLVLEDAPNGVAAACAAGMQVVMVPDPRLSPDLTRGATLVLPSLEHFRPELFGLPPF
ncbi:pseudouridine-5'-phosphatase-like isoform X1 [Bacillus rossius redtenbacheri]|uniref:pseudouridine-5'-phosphatase-like isoform X1 n=1 Tax=Bacillus rossius redtenbacheri TaxID=93214 RepID=UPI002FDC8F6B